MCLFLCMHVWLCVCVSQGTCLRCVCVGVRVCVCGCLDSAEECVGVLVVAVVVVVGEQLWW